MALRAHLPNYRWERLIAGILTVLVCAGAWAARPAPRQGVSATAPGFAASPQRPPSPPPRTEEPTAKSPLDPLATLTPKQKRDLMKFRFEKMKQHADELAELAESLQQDLDKSNENVLSLKVVEKAEKIEKLAKKIKETAKGD